MMIYTLRVLRKRRLTSKILEKQRKVQEMDSQKFKLWSKFHKHLN